MATFTFQDGNQGFYRYLNFQDFDLASYSATGATLNFDAGGYDATRDAWRIELTFSNVVEHEFEEGPDAGDSIFTSGSITGAKWYNDSAELILSATDLKIDLAYMSSFLNAEGFDNFSGNLRRLFLQEDSVFKGSADSMNLADGWDGDDISTGYGNDLVKAGGGDDFIKDLYGKDTYIGGSGKDALTYDEAFWNPELVKKGIKVDLGNKKIVGYDGMVDTVKGIEEVRGTFKKDSFIGDGKDNKFFGYQGNDKFDGAKGFDTVSYRNDARYGGTDGIKADLSEGFVRDGFGNKDKLKNIEGVEGTDANDVFIDSDKGDYFRLRDGDDTVTLSKGDDYVDAYGDGADLFIFKGNKFGYDVIGGFDDGSGDKIQILNAAGIGDISWAGDSTYAEIYFGSNTIRLDDFDVADLGASDFIFT